MVRFLLSLSFVLAVLAQASDGVAGTAYTVRKSGGTFTTQRGQFAVVADSGRIRADALDKLPEAVVLWDRILWADSSPMIALNSENQTWYELEPPTPFALSSHFLTPLSNATVKNLKMYFNEVRSEVASQRRYSGRLTYDVHSTLGGESVKVTCLALFDVTTTEEQLRRNWLGRMLPLTGYPAVDEKFLEAETAIRGFPLLLSLTVKRTYAGGPAMSDATEVQAVDIREMAVTASSFTRPTGYRHQRPVVGVPGQ